jgi:tetratricopeptide (TPR) repeat protein
MKRNGFWPPAGEIDFDADVGVSTITDVAVGPENTWTIIDSKRNKLYTYDFNGNLLFAFGDKGSMLGSISNIGAVTYQNDTLLVLDRGNNNIIVYKRTEYGDLLLQAIAAENSLDYSYAIECWNEVLQRNSNFDAAYVGIGNALYRSGEYEEAMSYYEVAYETDNWSSSYQEVRKEWMSTWFIPVLILIVLLIVAVVKFFGYAAKVNKRVATDGRARKTYWQELLYGFYVIFHPFDGFYDLKHEHRGSIRASITFIALTILTFFYQSIGQGYVLNPRGTYSTIFAQTLSILVPLFLFVLANWCLTTLFEGEGSFKDIFIASSYSLLPLIILILPATIASNWVTSTEAEIVTFIGTLAFIWVGILLFFGTMVTHDYSMFKNVITIAGTIVAMACIVFIVLLFSMLLSKLVSLVTNIVTEIQYRV